ncbi:hypothetical protein BsWGS_23773 [Bradybaena similaris]
MIRVCLCVFIALTIQCVFSRCDLGWSEYRGFCYSFSAPADTLPWLLASSSCLLYNARLVQVDSEEKNNWVVSQMVERLIDDVWIGGSCRYHSATWEWVPSLQLMKGFSNWYTGQPGNPHGEQCLHIYKAYQYKWDDAACTGARRYICEKRAYK